MVTLFSTMRASSLKYLIMFVDQVKEDEMDRACSTIGGDKECI
jgi:hypothetical protein